MKTGIIISRSQMTKKYKCDNCEDGTVRLIIKTNGRTEDISTKPCDKCGKSFGLKAIGALEAVNGGISSKY
jgi:transcription elongation factor Elf1